MTRIFIVFIEHVACDSFETLWLPDRQNDTGQSDPYICRFGAYENAVQTPVVNTIEGRFLWCYNKVKKK